MSRKSEEFARDLRLVHVRGECECEKRWNVDPRCAQLRRDLWVMYDDKEKLTHGKVQDKRSES